MGLFTVRVGIAHPTDRTRHAELDLWVDSGATFSQVPRELLGRLGLPTLARRVFLLADGREMDRETAGAILQIDGHEAHVTVIVGEPGDEPLLGATSLESLGFVIDPVAQRLIARKHLAQF